MSKTKTITLQQKRSTLMDFIQQHKMRIQEALPGVMTAERMIAMLYIQVTRNTLLLKCTQESVIGCVFQCAQWGFYPGDALGYVYFVPFWNDKDKIYECQILLGYKGYAELAYRSSQTSYIDMQSVYENDTYQFQYGLNPILNHIPAEKDRGELIAAYALARMKDGSTKFIWMWKEEIDKHKAMSKAKDKGPWVTHEPEMGQKTTVHKLCKLLPKSPDLQKGVHLQDMYEAGMPQKMDTFIDFKKEEKPSRLEQFQQEAEDAQAEEIKDKSEQEQLKLGEDEVIKKLQALSKKKSIEAEDIEGILEDMKYDPEQDPAAINEHLNKDEFKKAIAKLLAYRIGAESPNVGGA